MKKGTLSCGLLLFLATAVIASAQAKITITAPADGSTFIFGTTCTIQWTHSAYYNGTTQKCTVYCGMFPISPLILVTQDQFVWTVGQRADGTTMAAGTYEITIESPDYDALDGPNITIKPLMLKLDRFNKLLISKIPDCPMCYGFDPKQLLLEVKFPFWLELFRGQRSLGILGKFAPGRMPTSVAKLVLDKSDLPVIQKRETGFEVRVIIDDNNRVLQTKAVMLEIRK